MKDGSCLLISRNTFRMFNPKTYITRMRQWWMCVIYFLITMMTRGNVSIELDVDVLDAIAGETLLVKTWTENHQLKSITVLEGNTIRLNAFMFRTNFMISKDQKGVILLKYIHATRTAFLILENVNKEDATKYTVDEIVADNSSNFLGTKAGRWKFLMNVIDPSEITKCNVGGSISMKFRQSSISDYLYYYDHVVANVSESDCRVLTHSHLYGRLWCSIDNNRLTINIENVTQRDTGLYKVVNNNNNGSERSYLNVTGQQMYATIGENVTIDWFYSQQAINRTLRIIHSKNGIIMNMQPNNEPQIVPDFQMRLVYSGDVSRCYMSFILLNIGKSDSGVYKIETLHGNTVSGCKHLIVQGITTSGITSTKQRYTSLTNTPSTYTSVNIPSMQYKSVTLGYPAKYNTSSNETTHVAITNNAQDQQSTVIIGVAIHVVIPVITAMVVVIFALIVSLIWIQHRKRSTLEADLYNSTVDCDNGLYITPIGGERLPPIPLMNAGNEAESKIAENAHYGFTMRLLQTTQTICNDGYELINISSNDDSQGAFNNSERIYESTEASDMLFHDNSGYLTVVGVLETSV